MHLRCASEDYSRSVTVGRFTEELIEAFKRGMNDYICLRYSSDTHGVGLYRLDHNTAVLRVPPCHQAPVLTTSQTLSQLPYRTSVNVRSWT